MHFGRRVVPYLALLLVAGATAWALSFGTLPPADMTFVNETEIKTVDPAVVTGNPEGRIIRALFEGLTSWNAKTLDPEKGGLADDWTISDDRLTYTFHIRENAVWSNGEPFIAKDLVWSYRRFLHPATGAEYAYQLWYVKNAKKYTGSGKEIGDPVEVELTDDPPAQRPFASSTIVKGTLVEMLGKPPEATEDGDADSEGDGTDPTIYVVEIKGHQRRFKKGGGDGAEDFKYLLLDFEHSESGVGIRALDDDTIQFVLNYPTPQFLSLVGFYPLFPVNRACFEKHGYPAWTKPENIVTSGPYRLAERRIRDRIRLVKSQNYWNKDEVYINVIDALAVEQNTTALNLYLTGQADWIPTVPPAIIPELKKRDDFKPRPYLTIYFYRVNTTRGTLKDPRVRRALSLAMDREEICKTVAVAGEIPGYSIVPPGLVGYEPAFCGKRNIEEAKRLLAEAGYPNGRGLGRVEILYNTQDAHKSIAELLQSQWKKALDIDIRLRNLEWNAYQADVRKLNYDVARAGWIADYNDPNTFLDMFVTGGANNQTGWGNPEYDSLIDAAARELDGAERMRLFHDAEQILMNELPVIPIYYYVSKNMVRPYFKGWYDNAQDVHPYQGMRIDVEEKKRLFRREGLR